MGSAEAKVQWLLNGTCPGPTWVGVARISQLLPGEDVRDLQHLRRVLEGGHGGCQTTSVVLVVDDNFEIDLELYELRWSGASVPLEPQAFDVLAYLVRHRDRVVSKEELMDQVWGGRFVTEAAVTGRIKQVRRALGDDGHVQRTLRTVHGRGYHFVADVHEAAAVCRRRRRSGRGATRPSATRSATACTSPTR